MKRSEIMNRKIPTLLGLFILIAGLATGIYLVNQRTSLESKAGPTESPKNVKVSNKSATGFSISWTTDIPMTGYVKYSEDPAKINLPAGDVRDQISGTSQNYTNHYVNITGLGANKTYYLVIGSGSQTYNDNGKPFQIRTWSMSSTPPEDVISGKVVTAEGSPVNGGVVFVEVEGGESLSTISKNDGLWRVNLASSRDKEGKVITYDATNSIISIFVQAGTQGTATATTNTGKSKPVPDIVLGKNQAFVEGKDISNSLSLLSENETTRSAAFKLTEATSAETGSSEGPLKLIYPAIEGELIATSSPQFRGTMTPETQLGIKIGDLEEEITVGKDGTWTWSPTSPLSSGQQSVMLVYLDPNELPASLSRKFVVVAMGDIGGLPSFTATPSATPELTPTIVTTMPETENPELANSGTLEMTMGTLLLGLLLILSGGYLKKKWNH